MRQLVELQKHAEKFEALNAQLIFVFREESKGVEGLKTIQKRHKTEFTLSVDLNKKSSKAYSPKKGDFDNYVIDQQGNIVGIVPGTLRTRATVQQLTAILEKAEASGGSVTPAKN